MGGEEEITFELACGDITKEELIKKIINEIMKEKRKKEKKEVENIDIIENQKKENWRKRKCKCNWKKWRKREYNYT